MFCWVSIVVQTQICLISRHNVNMTENGAENVGEEMEVEEAGQAKVSYEDRLLYVTEIAKPMASKKLTKKIYKLIKKG